MALFLTLALLLPTLQASAAESAGPATLHLSFDDFAFLEHDFVARGGHKTIEERGLTLEEGRFGQGLRMNLTPHIDLRDEMSGADLDEVVAVIFRTWRHREHWTVDNQPFLWGAGRFNTASGAVAFWVKGELTEGELFNQSAMAWGRAEKHLLAITVGADRRLSAHLVDARYVRHEIRSKKKWDPDRWNHLVLNWDKARGLELIVNGETAASSRGTGTPGGRRPCRGCSTCPCPTSCTTSCTPSPAPWSGTRSRPWRGPTRRPPPPRPSAAPARTATAWPAPRAWDRRRICPSSSPWTTGAS